MWAYGRDFESGTQNLPALLGVKADGCFPRVAPEQRDGPLKGGFHAGLQKPNAAPFSADFGQGGHSSELEGQA
jgi:hypothetical protein